MNAVLESADKTEMLILNLETGCWWGIEAHGNRRKKFALQKLAKFGNGFSGQSLNAGFSEKS